MKKEEPEKLEEKKRKLNEAINKYKGLVESGNLDSLKDSIDEQMGERMTEKIVNFASYLENAEDEATASLFTNFVSIFAIMKEKGVVSMSNEGIFAFSAYMASKRQNFGKALKDDYIY